MHTLRLDHGYCLTFNWHACRDNTHTHTHTHTQQAHAYTQRVQQSQHGRRKTDQWSTIMCALPPSTYVHSLHLSQSCCRYDEGERTHQDRHKKGYEHEQICFLSRDMQQPGKCLLDRLPGPIRLNPKRRKFHENDIPTSLKGPALQDSLGEHFSTGFVESVLER